MPPAIGGIGSRFIRDVPERQSLSALESGKAAFVVWGKQMARFTNPLARVRVASPCKADWDQMIGTDRVRFCGQCNLNVYNLSAMTRDQAESVIAANEGRLCVRFYRRRDGSIITQDCPVGLRAARQRLSSFAKAVAAAALTFLASIGIHLMLLDASIVQRQSVQGMMVVDKRPWPQVVVETPQELGRPEVGGLAVGKWSRSPRRRNK